MLQEIVKFQNSVLPPPNTSDAHEYTLHRLVGILALLLEIETLTNAIKPFTHCDRAWKNHIKSMLRYEVMKTLKLEETRKSYKIV